MESSARTISAVTGGSFAITAASHGPDANDSIRITGSTSLSIGAGKDGLHAENGDDANLGFVYISGGALDIAAKGDGISAGASVDFGRHSTKSPRAAAKTATA